MIHRSTVMQLVLLLLVSFPLFLQAQYLKGSYTTIDNIERSGYLLVKKNPDGVSALQYKATKRGTGEEVELAQVKTITLGEKEKYEAFIISIDRGKFKGYTDVRKERRFLELREEGNLNLYRYRGADGEWLFLQRDGGKLIRLYTILQQFDPATNILSGIPDTIGIYDPKVAGTYKQTPVYKSTLGQLTSDCRVMPMSDLELKLSKIERLVRAYNKCNGARGNSYFRNTFGLKLQGGRHIFGVFNTGQYEQAWSGEAEFLFPGLLNRVTVSILYEVGSVAPRTVREARLNLNGRRGADLSIASVRVNYYVVDREKLDIYLSGGLTNYSFTQEEGTDQEQRFTGVAGVEYQIWEKAFLYLEGAFPSFPGIRAGIGYQFGGN